jgi:hypothetical protein
MSADHTGVAGNQKNGNEVVAWLPACSSKNSIVISTSEKHQFKKLTRASARQ